MQGEHKVSMTRDARGHTALSAAIARTRKKAVRLLLTAIVEGRISRIPDSMGPVLECFVPLCACSAARTSARLGSGAKPIRDWRVLCRSRPSGGPCPCVVARRVQTYPKLFLRFLRDMPLEEEAELLGEDESEMDISQMHVRGSQLRCPVGKPGFWFDLAKPATPAAATAAAAAHSQSEPPASLRCCRCWLGWWCGCAEPAITDGAAVEPSASHSSSAAGASPRGEPKQASWSSPPVSTKPL